VRVGPRTKNQVAGTQSYQRQAVLDRLLEAASVATVARHGKPVDERNGLCDESGKIKN
jgi:hypothetical protein